MPDENTAKVVTIEITPTPSEYQQLCEDLGELRKRGAETNTEAILQAVRAAAVGGRIPIRNANGDGAHQRPNPRNRKVSS